MRAPGNASSTIYHWLGQAYYGVTLPEERDRQRQAHARDFQEAAVGHHRNGRLALL